MSKIGFNEKLQMISEVYFETRAASFSEAELAAAEKNLRITVPAPLREFYLAFGGAEDLLKCMYDIAAPKELYIENNILMIAREHQNVCGYGIDIDTQKPVYFDSSNNITKALSQDIEDFLIYLLALQGTELLSCIGRIPAKSTARIEKYLKKLSESDGYGAVFCGGGIIGVAVGSDVLLCARDDDCMERLEAESGLDIDYL